MQAETLPSVSTARAIFQSAEPDRDEQPPLRMTVDFRSISSRCSRSVAVKNPRIEFFRCAADGLLYDPPRTEPEPPTALDRTDSRDD